VKHHLPLVRQVDQVGEIRVGADQVGHDADLTQHELHAGERHRAAVTDQVVRAARAQHPHRVADRAVLPDEVEHRVGAPAGELADLLCLPPVGGYHLVRAAVQGQFPRILVGVHRDDLRGGHHLEALDADVTQPADAHGDRG